MILKHILCIIPATYGIQIVFVYLRNIICNTYKYDMEITKQCTRHRCETGSSVFGNGEKYQIINL